MVSSLIGNGLLISGTVHSADNPLSTAACSRPQSAHRNHVRSCHTRRLARLVTSRFPNSSASGIRKLRLRGHFLVRRLLKPRFKTCLTGLHVTDRNKAVFAQLGAEVTRVRISDHL